MSISSSRTTLDAASACDVFQVCGSFERTCQQRWHGLLLLPLLVLTLDVELQWERIAIQSTPHDSYDLPLLLLADDGHLLVFDVVGGVRMTPSGPS